jgi:hypothetical protein
MLHQLVPSVAFVGMLGALARTPARAPGNWFNEGNTRAGFGHARSVAKLFNLIKRLLCENIDSEDHAFRRRRGSHEKKAAREPLFSPRVSTPAITSR